MDALAYVIELMELNIDYFDIGGDPDYSKDEEDYAYLDNESSMHDMRPNQLYNF